MGLYGVLQYVAPPAWDVNWLENLNLHVFPDAASFGSADPLQIRVWSTANGPGVFAFIMMCGLLLLLVGQYKMRILAGLAGGLTLILSSVRISWIGFTIGLILLCVWEKRRRLQLLAGTAVIGAVLISFGALLNFREGLLTRLETFQNIQEDGSFQDRLALQEKLLEFIATHPFGLGLCTKVPYSLFQDRPLDSGILRIPLYVGWAGAVVIGLSLLSVLRAVFRRNELSPVSLGFKAIIIATFVHLPSGEVFSGPQGYFFWSAVSFVMMGQKASFRTSDHAALLIHEASTTYK
jgi:hypothetical protein